jgi:IS605 OrfB family transposase
VYSCQQVLISTNSEAIPFIEFICLEANKLANCAIYCARQVWFKKQKIVKKYALDYQLKSNPHFKALRSAVAQQVLHKVGESFSSYSNLRSMYFRKEVENFPKPPKYKKKGGMSIVSYPARWLKLVDNRIVFSLGKQVKAWFGVDSFSIAMPSNLNFYDLKEVRFLPKNQCFYAEFVTKSKQFSSEVKPQNFLAIDHGLDNWLTCVSNVGSSFILNGRKVKSQNQWYNKQVASLKKDKPQGFWHEDLAAITEKRNRQMRDNVNKAARFVISWCLENQIGTVIFGWNNRQQDSINLGAKSNQEFVQIPTAKLKHRLSQLCSQYSIKFVETEESYTSKSSFLDNDTLPVFGTNEAQRAVFSGERGRKLKGKKNNLGRGGYISSQGFFVNSDAQASANIAKKVASQLGLNLAEIVRDVLTRPHRYDLSDLNKFYRKRCEETRLKPVS